MAGLVALLLAVGSPARAQTPLDAEQLGLDVTVGYSGRAVRGAWLPVAVTLAPSRLFAGDVGVVADTGTGQVVESRPVEVAAGSTKVFRFLVPPSHALSVQVAAQDAEEGLTVRPALDFADGFLVGVLGDTVPRELAAVTSQPLDQRGVVVPVPLAFVERSSRALDQLSALVVTAPALTELSDGVRDHLTAAVAAGLDLVVTAATPGPVELPLPWQPATAAEAVQVTRDGTAQAGYALTPAPLAWGLAPADLGWGDDTRPVATAVNAGRGRVLLSGLPLGEGPLGADGGYWGRLLQPNRAPVAPEGDGGFQRLAQAAGEGLRSDQVSLPAIPVFAAALLVYLLLVGPVNGIVLARLGRRELAWATIPALTLVFTGGAFVASAGTESGTGMAGRAAYWVDGAGTQVQAAAVRAPRPGEHQLAFDGDDWDVAPAAWSQVPSVVERTGGDTVMHLDLEALQVGTALAFRDLSDEAPLGIDVDPTEGGARVTVTNRSGGPVDDVQVRAGTIVERLGTLADGATAVAELDQDALPVVREWHDEFAGLRAPDGTVTAPRSLEALLRWTVLDGSPGVVWATGTVPHDLALGLPAADGEASDDRGSFVAVGVTAGVPGTDTLAWEVDRQLLQLGFGEGWRPGPLAIEGRVEVVLRYRLPHEGSVARLVSSLERGQLQGQFGPGFAPPPPVEEVCEQVEERDDDGNLVAVHEECRVEGVVEPAGAAPLPECPPDAVSCSFDGDSFEFCFPDGSCQGGGVGVEIPAPRPVPEPVGGVGLEVWDPGVAAWLPVADAFADGSDTARLVGPLGEVFVRAAGELHPFDFSGRGIAAVRGEA